jgi:hypothetical protein
MPTVSFNNFADSGKNAANSKSYSDWARGTALVCCVDQAGQACMVSDSSVLLAAGSPPTLMMQLCDLLVGLALTR